MIQLNQSIFSIGSCFSDMIAGRLSHNKWSVTANPFGTLYDPISIERNISNSLSDQPISDALLGQREDVVFHYYYHSDLSALSLPILSNIIELAHEQTKSSILNADWIVLTYGSTIVYKHKELGEMVANCHKVPQNQFDKEMLTQRDVRSSIQNTIECIRKVNPNAQFILTVSPVRHLKHGMEQNMLSKSILRLACEEIVNRNKGTIYFPSYEIMMDELRDYKYYKQDKVHPAAEAEDYIWDTFKTALVDENAIKFIEQWDEITRALQHRPMHVASKAHQRFLKETLMKLEELSSEIDVTKERAQLQSQLI
ncbi:MAG: GSCFA domain-containing protein [Cyclobacteriaceae bacterium]